eukprot:TRINITY_DN10228_c0_g1_i3.p1 TRINITY_DN10228_c0_g1~~TRINITY_DN10228_c0_g1_i3.p1  ORF type:complete len:125 (+),score=46.94 TRINITY_DN10228_c0_g1_i3:118-492(+)
MIRRPPRSTLSSSSAASDVYKRQYQRRVRVLYCSIVTNNTSIMTAQEAKLFVGQLNQKATEEDVRQLFNFYGEVRHVNIVRKNGESTGLSLIHISEPTRLLSISYAVFCLKKKKKKTTINQILK